MPAYFLMRVASIVLVALVAAYTPNQRTWLAIVYSVGFSHYLLALIYSKRQFTELRRSPLEFIPLISIVVFGAGLYMYHFPLVIYFGLHHAFNEAYIHKHTLPSEDPAVRMFRGSAVLLHLALYFFLVRRGWYTGVVDAGTLYSALMARVAGRTVAGGNMLAVALAVSYVIFFYYLYRIRSLLTFRSLFENCALEVVGLGAVAASFYFRINFLHVVFYHFVFWTLFPLPKIFASGLKQAVLYFTLTLAATASFLFLSPIGVAALKLPSSLFQQQFSLWSYLHITVSFVLSNAHPGWIVELFRPRLHPGRPAQAT